MIFKDTQTSKNHAQNSVFFKIFKIRIVQSKDWGTNTSYSTNKKKMI